MISLVKNSILNQLKRFFADESEESLKEDITYKVAQLSNNTFIFTKTANIEALNLSKRKGRTIVQDGVEVQTSEGPFLIRATDLAADSITIDELSTNDKIVINGQELSISSIDKSIRFVILVITQGG